MQQFLVIIRGAPASGKTTIAKKLRNFQEKVVWLKVDNFKDFFSEDETQEEQRYVDESALATLNYLIDQGFSVVMEKIFYNPFIIPKAQKLAQDKKIHTLTFQIRCSLETLRQRDLNRPGVKEGLRKPLGDETIEKLYNHLEDTFLPGAIELNTEKHNIDECVNQIKTLLD